MMPAADVDFDSSTLTGAAAGGGAVTGALAGAAARNSLPGIGGTDAWASSIGIVIVCPARLTEAVHADPSQYRPSVGDVGS